MTTVQEWYRAHGCEHAHCPDQCEHPQPVLTEDGRLLCGRCFFRFRETVEMIPCTPQTCED